MPNLSVNHSKALANLEQAVRDASEPGFEPSSRLKNEITNILCGTHLTYKYILTTALLAKATEPSVNPLALQSGAEMEGAYDARSLCHKVIVPHEARLLLNGLGGSNEPFLNKPARFKTIDLNNAVRQGKDRRCLITLHAALSSLKRQKEAKQALSDLVYVARKQRLKENSTFKKAVSNALGGRTKVNSFLERLMATSVHGETTSLVAALLFWLMGKSRGQEWTVELHPVNESGASSNEIGDIDVFFEESLVLTAEIKDKAFRAHDVEHAVKKVAASGYQTLYFIKGPRAELKGAIEASLIGQAEKHNVELVFLHLASLIPSTVFFASKELRLTDVAAKAYELAKSARLKEETMAKLALALA